MRNIKENLINAIKDQNEALVDLILGILISGVLLIAVGLVLAPHRLAFLVGALLGTGSSVFRAVHMAQTLKQQMYYQGRSASAYAARNFGIRYIVMFAVLLVSLKIGMSALVGAAIGIFLMKPAAWLAPLTHRYLYERIFKN